MRIYIVQMAVLTEHAFLEKMGVKEKHFQGLAKIQMEETSIQRALWFIYIISTAKRRMQHILMTVFMIFIFLRWANERDHLQEHQKTASDYRIAGYFFFAMATYTLCPLLGVKTFALAPEKMIQYGLQAEAASLAFHILIELVLGWIFIALSVRKEKINEQ